MIINIDSDRFVKEVIEGNEYSFLFKDLVVIDLGCNIGSFSFWIYKLSKVIYAIDMVKEYIDSLNRTISENNLEKIKTYCIAIAGNNEPRKYIKDTLLGGGGSLIDEKGTNLTDCITLKQFMDRQNIEYVDVLKMDIEGLEKEVLEASDFPSDRIHTILGEVHKDERGKFRIIKDVLEKMGYRYTEPKRRHFLARKL